MTIGWRYAGASVIGTSHLKSPGGVCQDSHRCAYLEKLEVLVCVVSDGAGSALCAERGSQATCELVIQLIGGSGVERLFTREFALYAVQAVRGALADSARFEGFQLRDYACTMLVAIVGADQASFWQIGDGAICFRTRRDDGLHYAFWPAHGEYANVTEFVTDARALEELQFDAAEMSVVDVALFSDGLERLALDFKSGEVHEPFFSSLFPYLYRRPEGHLADLELQIQGFLGSARVNAHTDDDKTLILATRSVDAV